MTLLHSAFAATQRQVHHLPRALVVGTVEANVYPGGFDRVPGCLAAAVYRVPGRPRVVSGNWPDTLWLVACYRGDDPHYPKWTEGLIGDVPTEPPA